LCKQHYRQKKWGQELTPIRTVKKCETLPDAAQNRIRKLSTLDSLDGRKIYTSWGYPCVVFYERGTYKQHRVHRMVMEKVLGRKLKRKEVVHHKDHNRMNPSPENLELFANHSKHMIRHRRRGVISP